MQLIGPLSDDLVLCYRPVVDLILEDVVASGSVAILIKGDRCPCTSCKKQRKQQALMTNIYLCVSFTRGSDFISPDLPPP